VIGRRFVPLVLVLALTSAASAVEPAAPGLGYDHPLTGRVWDVTHSRFVTLDTLATAVSAARFALLGERHDHPEHHQFQAWLLRRMVEAGRRPAVAFEMLDTTQAPALARHLAAAPRDAAGLGDAVGWRASGWPAWRLYQPIAETALAAGLPIVAGNLPATAARAVARGDLGALDPALVAPKHRSTARPRRRAGARCRRTSAGSSAPRSPARHGAGRRRRQIAGDDRQPGRQRGLGDRLVEAPRRPAGGTPAHGVAEAGRVAGRRRQVTRERGRLRRVEHLERDGGPPAGLDHPAQQPRLELVMLGMIVTLAEQREPRRAHRRRQRVQRDEAAVRHVPDASVRGWS